MRAQAWTRSGGARALALRGALLSGVLLVAGCPKSSVPPPPPIDAQVADVVAPAADTLALLRAADVRRAKDVPAEVRTSHEAAARRLSARALARIADASSLPGLLAHLADDDAETVAWAAYGLGFACKGHEDAHVRALSARAASLESKRAASRDDVDPRTAVARAIGRCAGALGEQALLDLFKTGGPWEEAALAGLGDLASRRKQLGPDAMTTIIEGSMRKARPTDGAFYALSRVDVGEGFGKRIFDAAKAALARPGDFRILAIKTLSRAGKGVPKEAAAELLRVVTEKGFSAAEKAEAARALGGLGEPGKEAAADALGKLTPDKNDAIAVQELLSADFHVLYTLVGSTGAEPPKKAEPALNVLASLSPPSAPSQALTLRLARLRCAAALGLARGVYDAEILRKCDVETSEPFQKARLESLLRRPVTEARRSVFRTLSKSDHLRVREAAVEAIGEHAELGEVGVAVLVDALGSSHAGLVATAADVVHLHPERVMVLSASEKRAALDPKAPPPSAQPAQEVSRELGRALAAAMAREWKADAFETRISLLDAAAAVKLPEAKAFATKQCGDPNPTVREHASAALRLLGEKVDACESTPHEGVAAKDIDALRAGSTRIALGTTAGDLVIVLEPTLSPVTATRIASLAASGFYDGIVVHRVVPGFVAQFGDPEGDGYGGSGTPLRCETSPVPFGALDVGMALAGRDTGSSQLFVTLARTPHLDGEYTRVGRAEGDWWRVAEGDVILRARVE